MLLCKWKKVLRVITCNVITTENPINQSITGFLMLHCYENNKTSEITLLASQTNFNENTISIIPMILTGT